MQNMPANQFEQSQAIRQTQTHAPIQEHVHTAVTVTPDRATQVQSAAELQNAEMALRKTEHSYGFAF
jgi:hypothetical protein